MGPSEQLPATTPVVALDIDGVLNSTSEPGMLIPASCRWLDTTLRDTGAVIMLTSSWRHLIYNGEMSLAGFGFMLRAAGVTNAKVVGCLPESAIGTRLQEIEQWLARHAPHSPYAILDDAPLGRKTSRQVQVDSRFGLIPLDATLATQILRTPLPPPIPEHHIPTGIS